MRTISILVLGISLCLCACGGYGPRGPGKSKEGFKLVEVRIPSGDPVALDGVLVFTFTETVDEESLQDGSIVIETAAGEQALGTFVRGSFLTDRNTGMTIVVDPDAVSEDVIHYVEKSGDPRRIPDEARYDLGATSSLNGSRRVLFDRSRRELLTFIPDVPVLADLGDTAYIPATAYTVRLPVDPSLLALRSGFDRALTSEDGLPEEATFTTKALDDADPFLQEKTEGAPTVVFSAPENEATDIAADEVIQLRFSRPLDPASVGPDAFTLEAVDLDGRTAVPFAVTLQQTTTGLVEVMVLPLQPLSPDETYEFAALDGIRDLAGRLLPAGFGLTFTTASWAPSGLDISESFDTLDMMDVATTTASWGVAEAGALTGLIGDAQESIGQSGWFDQATPAPNYWTPVIDATENGGTIEVFVQGSREDESLEGEQPVDPDLDPERLSTTDWVGIDAIDSLDNYQYLRFRVVLTTEADGATTGRVPVVRSIDIPITTAP